MDNKNYYLNQMLSRKYCSISIYKEILDRMLKDFNWYIYLEYYFTE